MCKISKLIFLSLFSFLVVTGNAQNKYAVIVGINNYYEQPGVLSGQHSLKGCVNDALAIQHLLQNHFGFSKTNITTLLNDKATQKNVVDAFADILPGCKAGDAVFFYFCGHGIYINNPFNDSDAIKKGYNQALCMSDIYAPNLDCLLKDNTLKKIFNRFVNKKVKVTSIFDCCFSGGIAMMPSVSFHNQYFQPHSLVSDSVSELKTIPINDVRATGRAYKFGTVPTVADTEQVDRPSETKNSGFISISACSNYEIAWEVMDESNVRHGALTKSILSVYRKNPSDLSLAKLLPAITNEMHSKQFFTAVSSYQSPTYHYDKTRLKGNLLGISPAGFSNTFSAICLRRNGDTIIIDKGTNDDVARGNIFTGKNKTGSVNISVAKVYADSSVAMLNKRSGVITKGDVFTLTDRYTVSVSAPYLKVYVPTSTLPATAFSQFFNTNIFPFTKLRGYHDYNNWDFDSTTYNYFFTGAYPNEQALKLLQRSKEQRFYIFLPVPADISASLKNLLQKNQNIEVVNDVTQADMVLYLNYVNATENNKAGFVFTYRPALTVDMNPPWDPTFWIYHTQVPGLVLNPSSLSSLIRNINAMTNFAARGKRGGIHWLNDYAKR